MAGISQRRRVTREDFPSVDPNRDKCSAGKMLTRRHLENICVFTTPIFLLACRSLCEEAQKPPVADDTAGERATIKPEDLCILCYHASKT